MTGYFEELTLTHVRPLAKKLRELGITGYINVQRLPCTLAPVSGIATSREQLIQQIPHIVINLFTQEDANLLKLTLNLQDHVEYLFIKICVLQKDGT